MAFDVKSLFRFCNREISAFAAQHANERFYAFAIDGPLLCLNSEERFAEVWANHVDQWGPEYTPIKSWQDLDRNEQRSAKMKVLKYAQPRGLDHSDEAVRVEVINRYRQENRQRVLTNYEETQVTGRTRALRKCQSLHSMWPLTISITE